MIAWTVIVSGGQGVGNQILSSSDQNLAQDQHKLGKQRHERESNCVLSQQLNSGDEAGTKGLAPDRNLDVSACQATWW